MVLSRCSARPGDRGPWATLARGGALLVCLTLMGCPQAPPLASAGTDAPPAEAATEPASTPVVVTPAPADPSLSIPAGQVLPITAEVELGGTVIGLEVASTPQEQALGLMYRQNLPDDRGMLFPFSPPRPVSFWMKNVVMPLDMVFVHGGQIVGIAENVPPCVVDPCPTYGPGRQVVSYVIELRGGRAAELGLKAGDTVAIEWLEDAESESSAPESSAP